MSNSDLLCSVVIPWHRNFDDLKRAVDSVLEQDWANLEVIVVANGVTDATYKTLTELYTDPRFKTERLATAGASPARDLGTLSARGELIFLLDGDDRFDKTKLSRFVDYYKRERFDVAFSRGLRIRGDGVTWPWPVGQWDGKRPVSEYFFCDGCTISTSAIVLSARVREKLRFSESGEPYEDPDFIIRAEYLGLKVAMLPDVLYDYYDDRTDNRLSLTSNWQNRAAWIDRQPANVTEKARAAFRARCIAQHAFPQLFLSCLGWFYEALRLRAIPPRDVALFMLRGLIPSDLRRSLVNLYFKRRAKDFLAREGAVSPHGDSATSGP